MSSGEALRAEKPRAQKTRAGSPTFEKEQAAGRAVLPLAQRAGGMARLFMLAGAALGAAYILLFLYVALQRVDYIYELEWTEGAHLDQVRWILSGRFLYHPPTIEHLPLAYNPLYFYLAAAATKIAGFSFSTARWISILATLGTFGLLAHLVRRQSGSWPAGVIAAGLYAACYRLAGAWMDLAHTDALFLFLILLAAAVMQRWRSAPGQLAAGGFFVLAYLTKQMALPVVLPLAVAALLANRGQGWLTWLAAGLGGLLSVWALNAASDGWYFFYSFQTLTLHARDSNLFGFWTLIIPSLAPALLVAAGYTLYLVRQTLPELPGWRAHGLPASLRSAWELWGLAAALVVAGWWIYLKTWTYFNGLLLPCLGLALLCGLAVGLPWQAQFGKRGDDARPAARFAWRRLTGRVELAAGALLLLQLGMLYYSPGAQIPTIPDRQAGKSFIGLLRELPGDVLVFNHGYYSTFAGKPAHLTSVAYGDVAGGSEPQPGSDLQIRRDQVMAVFNQAVEEQAFEWVVVKERYENWFPYYLYARSIFTRYEFFWPVTGARLRPQSLMVMNPIARGGVLPLDEPALESIFATGWAPAQDGRRAMQKPQAALKVALEQKHAYTLLLHVEPFCAADPTAPTNQAGAAGVRVSWNDDPLGEVAFDGCHATEARLEIGAADVKKELNRLVFEVIPAPGSGGEAAGAAFSRIEFIQH